MSITYPSKITFPENGFSLGENLLLRENSIEIGNNLSELFPDFYFNIEQNHYLIYQFSKLENEDKAAEEILQAVKDNKKIRVIGDYDCDGIMSTTILMLALRSLNANASFSIPDRLEDGYGLNKSLIERAAEDGIELIITCDNGVSCKNEIELARSLGIEVIVTDHHKPTEGSVPENITIVNPKLNTNHIPTDLFKGYSEISGGFVALKVARNIIEDTQDYNFKKLVDELMFLAAVSTVSDVMPLFNENRVLLNYAFSLIEDMKRTSFMENRICKILYGLGGGYFLYNSKQAPTTKLFSFSIAPVINAVGRIGENVHKLVEEILECEKFNHFYGISDQFKTFNDERKRRTEEIYSNCSISDYPVEVLVLNPEDYSYPLKGLLGLIANRILNETNKPTFIGIEEDGVYSFSARGPVGFKLHEKVEEIKKSHPELGIGGGGHEQAMGVHFLKTEESLTVFRDEISKMFEETSIETEKNLYLLEKETIQDIVDAHDRFYLFGGNFNELKMYYRGFFSGIDYKKRKLFIDDYIFRFFKLNSTFEEGSEVEVQFTIELDDKTGPYFLIEKINEVSYEN